MKFSSIAVLGKHCEEILADGKTARIAMSFYGAFNGYWVLQINEELDVFQCRYCRTVPLAGCYIYIKFNHSSWGRFTEPTAEEWELSPFNQIDMAFVDRACVSCARLCTDSYGQIGGEKFAMRIDFCGVRDMEAFLKTVECPETNLCWIQHVTHGVTFASR